MDAIAARNCDAVAYWMPNLMPLNRLGSWSTSCSLTDSGILSLLLSVYPFSVLVVPRPPQKLLAASLRLMRKPNNGHRLGGMRLRYNPIANAAERDGNRGSFVRIAGVEIVKFCGEAFEG